MDQPIAIFNGSHTFVSPTGQHRTVDIRTAGERSKLKGKRVIALLTGPDNTSDFTGFGFVEGERIIVWRSKRGTDGPSAYEKLATLIEQIIAREQGHPVENEPEWVPQFEHLVEGRCIRCNRKLTNPESVKSGIGPECASRE